MAVRITCDLTAKDFNVVAQEGSSQVIAAYKSLMPIIKTLLHSTFQLVVIKHIHPSFQDAS